MIKKLALAFLCSLSAACADETTKPLPRPALDQPAAAEAVFAGGCFWGMQGVFEHVKGVRQVVSGYSGGAARTAHYERVSEGDTGHAESVRITYDPAVVSYARLLQVYFSVMDPTTRNAQGPDSGTQYRSEIFVADGEQRRIAKAYIAQLDAAHAFARPIVTLVSDLSGFYPAEAYHQDFLLLHPQDAYIVYNDLPKITALKRFYPELYQERPVTVAKR